MIAGFKQTLTMSEKTITGFLFRKMAKKKKAHQDVKLIGNSVCAER